MTLIAAELGTPHLIACPRCRDDYAKRHPIVIVRNTGVEISPWSFDTCRACGYLSKVPLTTNEETR